MFSVKSEDTERQTSGSEKGKRSEQLRSPGQDILATSKVGSTYDQLETVQEEKITGQTSQEDER